MAPRSTAPVSWSVVRHLVLAVGALSLVVACGDDDGPSSAAATSVTTPATQPVTTSSSPTTAPPDETGGSTTALPMVADGEPRYLWTIVTGAGGGLLLTRLDGSDPVRLATDVPGVHKHASWSPDGDRVVFVDEATETMWIAHLDGSPSEQVPGCDHDGCDYPAFSPDGTKLAYSRYENGPASMVGPASVGIEVVDLAGGAVTHVVRLERPLLADVPRWSPDGSQLVIGVDQMDDSGAETGAAVAVVPATGGEPTYLTDFSLYGYAPDWNTTTDEIVFSTSVREYAPDVKPDETWDAWAVRPDGTGLRQVTHAAPGEQVKGAKWTPDGSAILALSSVAGMVSIDPATGAMTLIEGAPDDVTSPKLRPAG